MKQACRALALGALVSLGSVVPSQAQDTDQPAQTGVKTSTLLNSGFEIVATNYLQRSIVLTLQRANRAFFCEVSFEGVSLRCVEIK